MGNVRKIGTHLLAALFSLTFGLSSAAAQTTLPEIVTAKNPRVMFNVNFGGMKPTDAERGVYKSSIMVGGGFNFAIGQYVQWDTMDVDVGFGTVKGSRRITLTDDSTRKTRNFQGIVSTGLSFNVPMKRTPDRQRTELSFGGGIAGIFQDESAVGVTTSTYTEKIECYSCFHRAYAGPYAVVRLMSRDTERTGGGIFVKYYFVRGRETGSTGPLEPQQWITVGLTVDFGLWKYK